MSTNCVFKFFRIFGPGHPIKMCLAYLPGEEGIQFLRGYRVCPSKITVLWQLRKADSVMVTMKGADISLGC